MLAVGHDQLQLDRLELRSRIRVLTPAVQDCEQRIDLAQVPEQSPPGAGDVHDTHRGGSHLAGLDDGGYLLEPRVGDGRHADVRLVGNGRVGGDLCARLRQRVEERRLAAVCQTDDSDLKAHGPRTLSTRLRDRCQLTF